MLKKNQKKTQKPKGGSDQILLRKHCKMVEQANKYALQILEEHLEESGEALPRLATEAALASAKKVWST